MGVHVDDGLCGGNPYFLSKLKELEDIFPFGSTSTRSFTFTGIHLRQLDDFSIILNQGTYIEAIEAINIPRERRHSPDEPITEPERTALRGLSGSLSYAAVNTRPELAAKVGDLQSKTNRATVKTLLDGNRVLNDAKRHKDLSIYFHSLPPDEIRFCLFSDASFSTSAVDRPVAGCFIVATNATLGLNQVAPVTPFGWSSKRIPRVVRSTFSAEAVALSNNLDRLSWVRLLWHFLLNPKLNWRKPDLVLPSLPPAIAVTDCKSVYDIGSKTVVPSCTEPRSTLECLLIKERLSENVQLRWIHSQAQLADSLTKPMDAGTLRSCLRGGTYSLYDENLNLKTRADKRTQHQWYKTNPSDSNARDSQ
jgi:hypothetical protein